MDASSGESGSSSYSVESIASFSSLTFERYTRRSLRHLMLGVYREQLLAEDDLPNQRIQALLDQHHATLVDQPDHFLQVWADRNLDDVHVELFRQVQDCWRHLFLESVPEQMRQELLAIAGHPRFPSRRWFFRTLSARVETTLATQYDSAVFPRVLREMNRLQADMLFINGTSLYLCALPVLDRQHFLNSLRARLGLPAVRY